MRSVPVKLRKINSAGLSGEAPNAESDGQSHQHSVADGTGDVGGQIEFGRTTGREWQHHKVHEEENGLAIEQPGHYRVFNQSTDEAAGHVVNSRSRQGNKEVQRKAKSSRGPSHLKRVCSVNSAGNA